jgi:hypothetical protein
MDNSLIDPPPPGVRPHWLVRALRRLGRIVLWIFILLTALWCVLALHFSNLPAVLRPWAIVVFFAASVLMLVLIKPWRRAVLGFLALAAVVFIYWVFIPPSNNRVWRPDVSVLSSVDVKSNLVTIHNVRHSEYRTADDFTLRYDDRTYDLDQLESVDFIISFWGQIPFGHTMVSFGFADGRYVCFSIETRPELHEEYSVIGGAFKKFELVYVVADERDVIRVRTNFRDEAVYLYRIVTTPEAKRRFFLRYCSRVNDLHAKPEWYWLLTRNCTTDIPRRDGRDYSWFPESWKIIVNGFVDQFLYNEGSLDRRVPLAELRKLGHVNTRAQNAGDDPEFSHRIRDGIPELK